MAEHSGPDWLRLATTLSEDDFARLGVSWFMVSEQRLDRPMAPGATLAGIKFKALRSIDTVAMEQTATSRAQASSPAPEPLVLAVRKVQEAFPSMITIGRATNNDVVIPDVTISRFHAFFRETERGLELSDAGGRNGTKVRGAALESKGSAIVSTGDRVELGSVRLNLLDARACYRVVRMRMQRR